MCPSRYQEDEVTISRENKDLNLCDNLTPVHCAFPENLPALASPPHLPTTLLSLARDGTEAGGLSHSREFLGFPMSVGGIQVIQLLSVFLLSIPLLF